MADRIWKCGAHRRVHEGAIVQDQAVFGIEHGKTAVHRFDRGFQRAREVLATAPGEKAKQKGMCIATRCTSVEQFIEMFHRFVDEDSFFVSTVNTRPPGLETSFSVQLADGTPVLRGLCVVLQAWTSATGSACN